MNSSFLHSDAWERFQTAADAEVRRYNQNLAIKRHLPRGLGHYWQSSRCNLELGNLLPQFMNQACFVRFEPVDSTSLNSLQEYATAKGVTLTPTLAVQPRQTSLIDISRPEVEILAGFKQKHRYNLKIAQKAGLEAESYSQNLLQHFPRFWALLKETANRQQFRTHTQDYYRHLLSELEKEQMAHLVFVRNGNDDLATLLLITYQGTATYLHGASTPRQREKMAPYLLHWMAIEVAKSLNCSTYDLWGTDAEYNAEKQEWLPKFNHASAGTTRFKLGFGGEILEYPGTFDLILKPFCYTVYKTLRAIRGNKRAFS